MLMSIDDNKKNFNQEIQHTKKIPIRNSFWYFCFAFTARNKGIGLCWSSMKKEKKPKKVNQKLQSHRRRRRLSHWHPFRPNFTFLDQMTNVVHTLITYQPTLLLLRYINCYNFTLDLLSWTWNVKSGSCVWCCE